jgi:hypothetical protein
MAIKCSEAPPSSISASLLCRKKLLNTLLNNYGSFLQQTYVLRWSWVVFNLSIMFQLATAQTQISQQIKIERQNPIKTSLDVQVSLWCLQNAFYQGLSLKIIWIENMFYNSFSESFLTQAKNVEMYRVGIPIPDIQIPEFFVHFQKVPCPIQRTK